MVSFSSVNIFYAVIQFLNINFQIYVLLKLFIDQRVATGLKQCVTMATCTITLHFLNQLVNFCMEASKINISTLCIDRH